MKIGLEQMGVYVSRRAGGGMLKWNEVRVEMYLNQVFFVQHPESTVGLRSTREMRTWGKVIDYLLDGRFGELGDVAIQRLKALETAHNEGSWDLAKHHELIPPSLASITGDEEKHVAARTELQELKLKEAMEKARASRGRKPT